MRPMCSLRPRDFPISRSKPSRFRPMGVWWLAWLPDGRQQFMFPNEHRLFLRAGDPAAARIAVQLLPDSPLKTVAPP